MSFFPSTLYFLTPNNQCQPLYGIFTSILFLNLLILNKKINLNLLILIVAIIIYTNINIFFPNTSFASIIINSFGLIIPLTIIPVFNWYSKYLNKNIVFVSFYLWFLIGLHQTYISKNYFSDRAEKFLQHFVGPRFSIYSISDLMEGRGVQFFTPEPASSAGVLVLFWFFFNYFFDKKQIKLSKFIILNVFLLYLIFLNKSITVIACLVPCFLFTGIKILKIIHFKKNCLYIMLLTLFLFGMLSLSAKFANKERTFKFINDIHNSELGLDAFLTFNNYAGQRSFNFIYSFLSILNNFGFGHLIDGWHSFNNFSNIMQIIKIDPNLITNFNSPELYFIEPIKPWSYMALITFCLGIVGILPLARFLSQILCKILIKNSKDSLFIFGIALFQIFFVPPTTSPAPWIILSLLKNQK